MTGSAKRWRRVAIDIAVIALGLFALSFLPPDTSLRDRKQQGVLRFCVPSASTALVNTADPKNPGTELSEMEGVADRLGLRLQVQVIPNMGRSFNPRDWHISRGQCDVIGGGLADSPVNRGFLTLIPNGGQIGLDLIGPDVPAGGTVGVYLDSAGLDRVKLSSWIRARGWKARPLQTAADLAAWLSDGHAAIASSLMPRDPGLETRPLTADAGQATTLAYGLWRGDMTLTRAVRNALQALD